MVMSSCISTSTHCTLLKVSAPLDRGKECDNRGKEQPQIQSVFVHPRSRLLPGVVRDDDLS